MSTTVNVLPKNSHGTEEWHITSFSVICTVEHLQGGTNKGVAGNIFLLADKPRISGREAKCLKICPRGISDL